MAGSTPILGLPYPTGTDPVSGGDNVIQALATALDGSAWVAPALGSGWTTGPVGTGNIQYRKDGVGNVHIQGALGYTGGPPGARAFVLPVGFRPHRWITGALQNATGGWELLTFSVLANGDVSVGGTPAVASVTALVNFVFSTVP